jgi:delta(3,5)-delta(2,4)-dienoyl-CoA isomerase
VVHSHALGMALDIVCATDIRICSKDIVFSVMEMDMAMVADLGSLQILPKVVGNQSWVKEICLTGRSFGAAEALSQGFINFVFETKEVAMQEAERMAKTMAEKSPLAIRGTKEVLMHAQDHTVRDGKLMFDNLRSEQHVLKNATGLEHVAKVSSVLLQSPDVFVALEAKKSKKQPRFAKL